MYWLIPRVWGLLHLVVVVEVVGVVVVICSSNCSNDGYYISSISSISRSRNSRVVE